jgi:hypothetical protein
VDVVRHHCIASATTPRFVMKCCFTFFVASHLSRRVFISAVASTHTWSKLSCVNASRLLAFIKRQISALFAVSTARQPLHFSIDNGAAICRTKQSRIIDYSPECSTALMMWLLPLKKEFNGLKIISTFWLSLSCGRRSFPVFVSYEVLLHVGYTLLLGIKIMFCWYLVLRVIRSCAPLHLTFGLIRLSLHKWSRAKFSSFKLL